MARAFDVIDQIEDIQTEVEVITLYNYPKTDGLGFMDLLIEHLRELQNCRSESIEVLKSQIETLHVEFDFLRHFLRKIKEQHHEYKELGDLWVNIIGLAYQVEYVIDLYLVQNANALDPRIMLSLNEVIQQTKIIKSKVTTTYDEKKYQTPAHNVAKISSQENVIGITPDEVVGFEDEAEKIMECLFEDMKRRDVLSIVGLPGLGKTTLARKIYEDPSIIQHFHVRAWCTVSQTYRMRQLLLTILGDIIGITEEINKLNDEGLAAKLWQSLKGRRYLIIIDDLWDVEAWDNLARSFPDDKNHSRILITSRLQNVASQTKVGIKVHHLRELSDDESWHLFRKKLFETESLSKDLEEVGKQIIEICERLPLAIVVIASLLAKEEKSVDKWKQIAGNLRSRIFSDSESPCKAIVELSYNHLPDHLKSCFLYFGAFVEDEEIHLWKLKWLWIAEGFVQNTGAKNLEDVAEDYCMDLINRSLVRITKEISRGGVKTCRVHDILHSFCLEKAKEESFLQVIHVTIGSDFSRVYDQRRLRVYSEVDYSWKTKPSGCSVRSLLHSHKYDYSGDISFFFKNFKLLRVLDLGAVNIGDYFSGIELLIHLRYLAITARMSSIPSSISNLWSLQSFLVKANQFSNREVVDVPDSLWDMVNLRHVHIDDSASFDVLDVRRLENSSLLDSLETLSTPRLCYGEDAENLLRRLPKLRKLRCIYYRCKDNSTKSLRFPVLDFLDQLMSLKITFDDTFLSRENFEFNFPSNLQKLTLSGSPLEWKRISEIGMALPELEVLKINGDNWDAKWSVGDNDFPKLKYLTLNCLYSFSEWNASDNSFPILEQLVLEDCGILKKIPPRFGELATLQMITVINCKFSVTTLPGEFKMNSARNCKTCISKSISIPGNRSKI